MRNKRIIAVAAGTAGLLLAATTAYAAARPRPGTGAGTAGTAGTAASPGSGTGASPGAPGAGDPYYPDYGNGGYDVSHYGLDLKYRPGADRLEGTATITARATQALSRFNLDFLLDVRSVTVNGQAARFASAGTHELVVTPPRALRRGQRMTVVVRYADVPSTKKHNDVVAWVKTPDGAVAANEPEMAWWWFPSNDHPTDKATYDIAITVPEGLRTISNGEPTGTRTAGGWTRHGWRQTRPQATYLATLAIGRFEVREGRTAGGKPVITAYSRDLPAELAGPAKASVERTAEVVGWAEKIFGPYPFTSLGGYVPNVPSRFALETQTRSFYSPAAFRAGPRPYLVVHENAHQWFGDSVALTSWRDIWLNEGFASYAEWLWSERHGEGSAAEVARKTYDGYPADDPFWKVKPGDPGPGDNQFHDAVYDRGAMTLQALRAEVGDRAFFAILRGWPAEHRDGNATTAQFIAYAEKVSGRRLDELFRTWLFTAGRPPAPGGDARPAPWARTAGQPAAAKRSALSAQPRSWAAIRATREALRH